MREANPWVNNKKLCRILIAERLMPSDHGDLVLEACGLSAVPPACSRAELARCLGTRFGSDEDAVPEMIRFADSDAAPL